MVTITWETSSTSYIEIVRSKDKLDKLLKALKYDEKTKSSYREIKKGSVTIREFVHGVSYDSGDELAMLRRYRIVPKSEEYPYEYPEIQ